MSDGMMGLEVSKLRAMSDQFERQAIDLCTEGKPEQAAPLFVCAAALSIRVRDLNQLLWLEHDQRVREMALKTLKTLQTLQTLKAEPVEVVYPEPTEGASLFGPLVAVATVAGVVLLVWALLP